MRVFLFVAVITAFVVLFGLLALILLKLLNRPWYDRRWVRRAAWLLPLVGGAAVPLWALGEYYRADWLALPMAVVSAVMFVMEIALMISLPVSGALHFLQWLLDRPAVRRAGTASTDTVRRDVLRGAAAAVPFAALSLSAGGVVRSFGETLVERRVMRVTGLPSSLEGIRLLHLSDLHLRHYVNLEDLEEILAAAAEFRPDLVCLIGDVADDLTQLPDALSLVAQLRPRLGVAATLGNHEYFRGIETVRRIFDRSPVPLLIDDELRFTEGTATLSVVGIDDPRGMRAGDAAFFNRALAAALPENEADFTLLLSHRPDAFPYAARRGIPLTLAGHTHGGQVGFMGRSVFEAWWPDKYLWGEYRLGESRLYTSSGAGHWFPFRLGCPAEAPVIELRRVDAPRDTVPESR